MYSRFVCDLCPVDHRKQAGYGSGAFKLANREMSHTGRYRFLLVFYYASRDEVNRRPFEASFNFANHVESYKFILHAYQSNMNLIVDDKSPGHSESFQDE